MICNLPKAVVITLNDGKWLDEVNNEMKLTIVPEVKWESKLETWDFPSTWRHISYFRYPKPEQFILRAATFN